MASKWADYGFPDNLHLAKPELVATGLTLAIKERWIAMGMDMSNLEETYLNINPLRRKHINNTHYLGGGAANLEPFCKSFDSCLGAVLSFYYDHTSAVSNIQRYNIQNIAAAAGIGDDFIPNLWGDEYKLTPHFQIKWAMQRYRIINVMRRGLTIAFAPVHYDVASRHSDYGGDWVITYGESSSGGASACGSFTDTYPHLYYSQGRAKLKYKWTVDASAYNFGIGVCALPYTNYSANMVPGTIWDGNHNNIFEIADYGIRQGFAVDEALDIPEYFFDTDLNIAKNMIVPTDVGTYIYGRISGDVEGGFKFLDIEEPEE